MGSFKFATINNNKILELICNIKFYFVIVYLFYNLIHTEPFKNSATYILQLGYIVHFYK